jgi:hypothetical protein
MKRTSGGVVVLVAAALLFGGCIPMPVPRPEPDSYPFPEDKPSDRPGDLGQDRRGAIYELAVELEQRASFIAQSSFDHFRGWTNAITDEEQAILFKSEAFAASCRLFLRLAETTSNYYSRTYRRTNLYTAFLYLARSFDELGAEMRRGNYRPYELQDCRRLLDRIEREFQSWPGAGNLASLDDKYVKGRGATVYLIVREGVGNYTKRPFKNLESLFKFNYDRKRGKNPWEHFVEVDEATLAKMRPGRMIDLTFEGLMIIEQGEREGRPVYLIEKGKRRGLTRPELVDRYGGWGKVYEVPAEVIAAYPEGDPIEAPASGHIKKEPDRRL